MTKLENVKVKKKDKDLFEISFIFDNNQIIEMSCTKGVSSITVSKMLASYADLLKDW